MVRLRRSWLLVFVLLLASACDGSTSEVTPSPSPTGAATGTPVPAAPTSPPVAAGTPEAPVPSRSPTSIASATPALPTLTPMPTTTSAPTGTPEPTSTLPTATPTPGVEDVRVTRLQIPSLAIDAEVYPAQVIPDTRVATPGCPAFPPGGTTWSVPTRGIATPQDAHAGLENTAWIFGHSRWQGTPDLFFALQDLSVGDELTANGVDRQTGEVVSGQRYRVEALYLSDTTSGGAIVYAGSPEEIPAVPTIVLQTSVRERGEGRPWILDRATLTAKANVLVDDLDDPCKYLLLFVVARAVG